MSDTVKQAFLAEIRKRAPGLLDEADRWLDSERRIAGHTDNATAQLVTALTEALRAEMKGWANARGDAVDYSLRAGELETIVRDLTALRSFRDDFGFAFECRCPTVDHADTCPYRRARVWVAAHPVSGTATDA